MNGLSLAALGGITLLDAAITVGAIVAGVMLWKAHPVIGGLVGGILVAPLAVAGVDLLIGGAVLTAVGD